MVVVGSWMTGVGIGGCNWFLVRVSVVVVDPGCRVLVVVVGSWLSGVGIGGCSRVSVSVVVVGSWVSGLGVGDCSWFLVVECRYRWL